MGLPSRPCQAPFVPHFPLVWEIWGWGDGEREIHSQGQNDDGARERLGPPCSLAPVLSPFCADRNECLETYWGRTELKLMEGGLAKGPGLRRILGKFSLQMKRELTRVPRAQVGLPAVSIPGACRGQAKICLHREGKKLPSTDGAKDGLGPVEALAVKGEADFPGISVHTQLLVRLARSCPGQLSCVLGVSLCPPRGLSALFTVTCPCPSL